MSTGLILAALFGILAAPGETEREEVLRDWTARGVYFVHNEKGKLSVITFPDRSRSYREEDFTRCGLFPSLEYIHLVAPKVPRGALRTLAGFRHIKSLDLGRTDITDDAVVELEGNTTVTSINLPNTVTNKCLQTIGSLGQLESFTCFSDKINDDDMAQVRKLWKVRYLALGRNVTARGIAQLVQLKHIEAFTLGTPGNDATLEALSQFPRLTSLSLRDWTITAEGFKSLSKFPNVDRLVMPKQATDDDFANVAGLKKLYALDLRWTAITDKGIEHLRGLKDLRMVNLSPTTSDLCIDHLVGLPRLISVTLRGPGFTDACIDKLITIKTLTYVDFVGTMVTPQGVARLRAAGPGLRVNVTKELK